VQAKLFQIYKKLSVPSLSYKIGSLEFSPSIIQAILIVFLIFLLVLVMARMRRIYLHWSLKGAASMFAVGFALALIIEGFMLIGGRTLFSELLGWENPPKPISNVLDFGREKMVNVLGINKEIPTSDAYNLNSENLTDLYESLTSKEKEEFRNSICQP
jgi:hypothetical protein